MLKYFLSLLFIITLSCEANAQNNSTSLNKTDTTIITSVGEHATDADDEEFNVMLFAIAIAFFGVALGAVMAGAFAVFLLLGLIVLLTIAGIVSASLIIGLYHRSLQAGFKSLLLILGCLLGIAFGLMIMWLINHFFHLGMDGYKVLLGGVGGGLIGGFSMAYVIYRMMSSILMIAIQRLKLTNVLKS